MTLATGKARTFNVRAFKDLSSRFGGYVADTTALAAIPAARRVDNMVVLAGNDLYRFDDDAVSGSVAPAVGTGYWKIVTEGEAVLTALAAAGGAALVGSTGPSTVQADITARPTAATLAAVGGAATIGSVGPSTVQTDITSLKTYQVAVASKTVGYADLVALGAVTDGSVDFAAALPAGAQRIAAFADVTAIFDNVGDTASLTFDLGIASGDTDAYIDGGSLNAVAKVATPQGVLPVAYGGGETPSVLVHSDVNLDTLTKGSAVFYVLYIPLWTP